VKRYVAEPGAVDLRELMAHAEAWFMCRVGFVETSRAVGLTGGASALRSFRSEWPAFGVIEVDQQLVERASELALGHDLRSLDALHLGAALLLPGDDLTVATWDCRLHAAASAAGLKVFPDTL
jgi:predicted nucleic acid-binding protein